MIAKTSVALIAGCALSAIGYCGEVRFFLGYGDEALVNLAISSGADPSASIGREIPSNSMLRVPSVQQNSGRFKVQFFQEYVSGGALSILSGALQTHIAYDQAYSSEGAEDQDPDGYSFRKLSYGSSTRSDCLSNFQQFPAWWFDGSPADHDGNGNQDTSVETSYGVFTRGSYGPGDSVRPIGLAATVGHRITGFGGAFIRLYKNQPQHLFDVEMRSLMVVGEQYGTQGAETGLSLLTNPNLPSGGDAGNSTYIAPHSDLVFTGAKYNLLAVPEPSSWLVLGLGLLVLRRRR